MSNSVRSLGSGRGVEAAARPGAGHQVDPDATDDAFATVMNLAIGATGGTGVADSDGTDADGGVGGQGSKGDSRGASTILGQSGLGQSGLGQSGDVPDGSAGAVPAARGQMQLLQGEAIAVLASANGKSSPAAASALSAISSDREEGMDGPSNAGKSRHLSDSASAVPQQSSSISNADSNGASIGIAAPALPASATTLEPVGDSDDDGGDPTDTVSAASPRRHRYEAPKSSAETNSPSADRPPSPSPGATAILLGNAVVAQLNDPSLGISTRQAMWADGAPAATSAFDRLGWRIRVDDGSPPVARFADQADPPSAATSLMPTSGSAHDAAMPSQLGGVAANSGQIFVPSSGGVQPDDISASTLVADPTSAPPPTIDQHDSPTVAPAPIDNSSAVLPAFLASPVLSVANDPRVAGRTSVTAVDGMASVPPPSAPDATSVTLASDNATAAGTASPFGDAVANHVFSMISAGHQEATLQLQPPQLGELTVRVAIQGRDVSTWFGTAQPQVQLAVNQALDQLRADLAGAGLNLSGAWVGADASSMQQRSFDTGAAPTRRPNFVAPSVDQVSTGNADPSRGSSGVNIYV